MVVSDKIIVPILRILFLIPGFILVAILISPSSAFAQIIRNPDSLSKNSFGWNQQGRELGFAHFDQVYKAREVPKGNSVHELPPGNPISVFSKGGQKENELNIFQ